MRSSLPPVFFNSEVLKRIESEVSSREGSYQNLNPEALYTSPEDFERIFSNSLVRGTFVDIGCGHGGGCIQYARKFPERRSVGIDFEESRISLGRDCIKALSLNNIDLIVSDLMAENIPFGDTYFLYFPTGPVLDKVLSDLYSKSYDFLLVAIESHGDLFSRLELENWLEEKASIPLHSARHVPFAKIYSRNYGKRNISTAFVNSYLERYLLIKDEAGTWIGDSLGLSWERENHFTLKHPPRTIDFGSVKTLKKREELDATLLDLIDFRKKGEVTIENGDRIYVGFIRKIYVSPVIRLEISTGEQVEWSQDLKINLRT